MSRTQQLRAWHPTLLLPLMLGVACSDAPQAVEPVLALQVDKSVLQADGQDSTVVTATVAPGTTGIVVSFSATGGLLSSSSAVPNADGVATVTLVADREEALLGRAEKPVTLRASVARDVQDVESATLDVIFVAPTSGAPSLSLAADPPAAIADGASTVTITLSARRLPAGTPVTFSTSAGTLSSASANVVDDGAGGTTATVTLTAPLDPAEAIVSVAEPSGAFADATVSFVEDGAAQFDLTGTFAQRAHARIRMTAGTLTPNPQCVVAPAIVKVDIVQTGDQIVADYTTCFVTLATVRSIVGEVTTTAPPAFYSAVPPVHAEFSLSDLALGAVFDPPASIVISGAELADPDRDELPTSDDDPRVRDSDGDGNPGVTVNNSVGGDQNVTFRNRGDTRGLVESGNRIIGETIGDLTALPESSVLGIGDSFIPDMESVPSVFELVRVDGRNGAPDMDTNGDGAVSCAEIVDAQDFLFTLQPPSTPLDCAGVP